MANPDLPFGTPMAFWGVISAAASEHMTVARLAEAVQAEADRLGINFPRGGMAPIMTLYSNATQLAYASERLGRAAPSTPITADLLAYLPYGRPWGQGAGPRQFDVRVQYTAVRSGRPDSGYVTLRYTGGLPGTVGELQDEAKLIAESLVEGYGSSFVDTGAIQIGEL